MSSERRIVRIGDAFVEKSNTVPGGTVRSFPDRIPNKEMAPTSGSFNSVTGLKVPVTELITTFARPGDSVRVDAHARVEITVDTTPELWREGLDWHHILTNAYRLLLVAGGTETVIGMKRDRYAIIARKSLYPRDDPDAVELLGRSGLDQDRANKVVEALKANKLLRRDRFDKGSRIVTYDWFVKIGYAGIDRNGKLVTPGELVDGWALPGEEERFSDWIHLEKLPEPEPEVCEGVSPITTKVGILATGQKRSGFLKDSRPAVVETEGVSNIDPEVEGSQESLSGAEVVAGLVAIIRKLQKANAQNTLAYESMGHALQVAARREEALKAENERLQKEIAGLTEVVPAKDRLTIVTSLIPDDILEQLGKAA